MLNQSQDRVDAICIDLDGTLLDSTDCLREAYESFLNARGVLPTDTEFGSLNGPDLVTIVKTLCRTHSLAGSHEENVREYLQAIKAKYGKCAAIPGATTLLNDLQSMGFRMALVSSALEELAKLAIESHGWKSYFGVIVCGDHIGAPKPSPEPYLMAVRALGVSASKVIAIEDSVNGIISARAAGLRTIAITREEKSRFCSIGADFIYSSLDELRRNLQSVLFTSV